MQSLEEQLDIVERALGERMINHAMVVARQWVTEIGFGEYIERIQNLEQNYNYVFQYYLTTEDPERDALLDKLTSQAYALIDDVYVSLRLERGLSPRMQGFNPDNIQSVIHYFSSCIQLTDADYDWLIQAAHDQTSQATALLAASAIFRSLRDCFNQRTVSVLLDLLDSESPMLNSQLLAGFIFLFAHYDVRIDFYPDLQDKFAMAIGDGEQAFQVLQTLVQQTASDMKISLNDIRSMLSSEEIPEEIQSAIQDQLPDTDLPGEVVSFRPSSELDYLKGLIEILPNTWVYSLIVGDSDERAARMDILYLENGKMEHFSDHLADAEQVLLERLTSDKASPADYINYAHCCFIRGDRMMAYEYYREARTKSKNAREFFAIFRPDRRILVEHGVPVEQVYLMEDQLLRI